MKSKKQQYLDRGTWSVALITLMLFILALFAKGLTHDLLLEAAVFLVSVKLIIGMYHVNVATKRIEEKIDMIQEKVGE